MRNGTLQGGYLIMAARALGFDCGPMLMVEATQHGVGARGNIFARPMSGSGNEVRVHGRRRIRVHEAHVCFLVNAGSDYERRGTARSRVALEAANARRLNYDCY
jgi:hypothetical protein